MATSWTRWEKDEKELLVSLKNRRPRLSWEQIQKVRFCLSSWTYDIELRLTKTYTETLPAQDSGSSKRDVQSRCKRGPLSLYWTKRRFILQITMKRTGQV